MYELYLLKNYENVYLPIVLFKLGSCKNYNIIMKYELIKKNNNNVKNTCENDNVYKAVFTCNLLSM